MSTAMMKTRPTSAEDEFWNGLEDFILSDPSMSVPAALAAVPSPSPAPTEFIELEPPIRVASQEEMRFGVQTYTADQARVIELAVRRRRPLGISPLPTDD